MAIKLKNGIFLAPFHPVDEDPTLCIQRDLELIDHLDRLGYEEAWIGEHHSAGYEIIASPEVFIAAAAERTKRIMLGSGVISLPYHNPLMLNWISVATALHAPAIAVQAGQTASGLPVGVQFIGPWNGDDRLFDFAAAVEDGLGGFKPPKI